MTQLESLKRYTIVVADTGDIEAIARHRPQDATTNPSLLYHAVRLPAYRHLVDQAASLASVSGGSHQQMAESSSTGCSSRSGVRFSRSFPGGYPPK